jgi:hypothetical protein
VINNLIMVMQPSRHIDSNYDLFRSVALKFFVESFIEQHAGSHIFCVGCLLQTSALDTVRSELLSTRQTSQFPSILSKTIFLFFLPLKANGLALALLKCNVYCWILLLCDASRCW